MSYFKLKEITLTWSNKWKTDNKPLRLLTKSSITLIKKIKILKSKQLNLRNNVKELKLNIKNFVKILMGLSAKTKTCLWNSKVLKILSESLKANLINLSLSVNNLEKSTLNLPMKTRSWTVRLISAFWVFWNTKRSTKTYNKKWRTTLLVMKKQGPCWIEKKPWEVCWSKWPQNFKRLKDKLPI